MNKKISTLLTGALLVGSVAANATGIGSVDAVSGIEQLTSGYRYYVLNTNTALSGTSQALVKAAYIKNGMAMSHTDAASYTKLSEINTALWGIKVAPVSGSNRFVFVNKADGTTLSFDPANAIDVSAGSVAAPANTDNAYQLSDTETEWTWVDNKDDDANLALAITIKSAFHRDSTMQVAVNASGEVFAFKYANTATTKVPTGLTALTIQAVKPGTITLTPADLNVLGDKAENKYFTLSTNDDKLSGNIFAGAKWQAQTIVANGGTTSAATYVYEGSTASTLAATTQDYVVLNKIVDGVPSFNFAHVDTAYWPGTTAQNKDLWYKFAVAKGKYVTADTELDALSEGGLKQKAFEFKFERDLFKDNVIVSINSDGRATKVGDMNTEVMGKKTYWSGVAPTGGATNENYLILSSALLSSSNVLTLYSKDVEVNIPFYVSAPAVESTATSVEDGLYYIKNKQGQYLAAPIYNTTNGETAAAKWVTVNGGLQAVAHMPAYQWVVLKKNTNSDAAKKVSPVTITNREFTATKAADVQLNQKDAASCLYAAITSITAATDSLVFDPIKDLAILSDTLLGYKNFEKDSLLVNRYTFNYLHDYATDKYIRKAAKDSLLQAIDGAQAFIVEKVDNIYNYGYTVDANVAKRIAGLKQLRRQAYQVYAPSAKGKLYLSQNAEHQYMITLDAVNYGTPTTFLFKEENDNGKHYHALLAVTENLGTIATETYTKVGVSDESVILKDQKMDETRTSAFNISKYDAPLYRRFNSLKLEGNEGDAPDTLRFVEKYRQEYLQIEANPNFTVKGIDFLGIYTTDKAKSGLSFIVDTAFVNRWAGDIKPQYLISIERQDQAFDAGERCPVCQALIDAGKQPVPNCPHDKAGKAPFHLGKYLVNFKDSVDNSATANSFKWAGYTRAGFVKAAHMGDSLYILKDQFADVTVATFDTAAIHKAVKDKKYAADNIRNLQEDAHKTVTWSMRFLNPELAAEENEADRAFLFESLNADGNNIAPVSGSWLKMQNGCLVMSGTADGSESTFDQITKNDDALIFNIEQGAKDDIATDNDVVTVNGIQVLAKEGAVQIAGATGKKVVITNILGQSVANTVLTSDDATIAAPKGIVVVAVEGEEAVKAIVK